MDALHAGEALVSSVFIQLVVILVAARLCGRLARALGQPAVMGEVVAGLLLGPSLFGRLFPELSDALFSPASQPAMQVLSQIGLVLLMFQIGAGFEFSRLLEGTYRRAGLRVAIVSILVPLGCGFLLGHLSAPHLAPGLPAAPYSLFCAVALAITAVPMLGRILIEFGLVRHPAGIIAMAAAAANDAVGWLLLAAIAAYTAAALEPGQFLLQIGGLLLLLSALWLLGRPLAAQALRRFPLRDGSVSPELMALVLAAIFLAGVATERLGVFTIFGGFLLGLLMHRHTEFVAAWERQVGQVVLVFFLPLFFTYTGLRTDIGGLGGVADWSWCLLFIGVAVLAKIVPVTLAARSAGLPASTARAVGVLMNTRGLMELIVLNVGLSLGVLPPAVFTMLVLMAVATTAMTGPLLRLVLRDGAAAEAPAAAPG